MTKGWAPGPGRRVAVLVAAALVLPSLASADVARSDAGAEARYGPRRDAYGAEGLSRQPPAPPPRKPTLRRMRTKTIDMGLQLTYGWVGGDSRLANGFDHGIGYAFRFRYMLKSSFELEFSFENQNYGASSDIPSTIPGASDSSVVMTTVSVGGVFLFQRERETNPFFLLGVGYASPDVVDENLGSARVNEGPFLVLGAGLERFVRDRFSLTLSLRGYGLVSNSEYTSFLQVCGGIQVYPGD
jgi:hypothetical protein